MTRVVVAAIAVVACATFSRSMGGLPPGYGVSEQLATDVGCELEDIKEYAKAFAEEARDLGRHQIPYVGMSVCRVLALLGVPDDIDLIDVGGVRSLDFWYQTGYERTNLHLISLIQTEWRAGRGDYKVDAIVW